jgi:hypothetical protein
MTLTNVSSLLVGRLQLPQEERPKKPQKNSSSSNKPNGYILTLPDGRCVYDTKENALAADKIDENKGIPIMIPIPNELSPPKRTRGISYE